MRGGVPKTFWDIEHERTWRIYALFGLLLLFYVLVVFCVVASVKLLIYIRLSFGDPAISFGFFGTDTYIALLAAGTAAYIHWYYSSSRVTRRVLSLLGARLPDRYDRYHGVFNNVVDEIETAAGGLKVERYVLPTGAMNAFALADLRGRKVIGVTEGLVSRLDRDELQSVVAHEMAHIVSGDCVQVTLACSLAGMYSEALGQLNDALRRGYTAAPFPSMSLKHEQRVNYAAFAVPAVGLLLILDSLSQFINVLTSRQREYRADASSIRLTRNPESLARALYKIGARWRGAGYGGEHLAPIFILNPQFGRLDEKEGFLASLFSTHPPLSKRLGVILKIAHSGMGEIARELGRSTKMSGEHAEESPRDILVRQGREWLGPFTLIQLKTLERLTPETELRIESTGETIVAGEVPRLRSFFARRSEPVWKMKRLCPICREWLVPEEYEGLYVWRCGFCRGSLAREDKLPRIFVREERAFTEDVKRTAALLREDARKKRPGLKLLFETAHPRPCPKCGQPMVRKFYSYAYHVEIDRCQRCRLVWFDRDELEILQNLIELETHRGQ
jgi:heat shock protein HtpX